MDISLESLISFFDSRPSPYFDLAEGIWDFQMDLDNDLHLSAAFFVYEDRVKLRLYNAAHADLHRRYDDNLDLTLCNVSSVNADENQLMVVSKDRSCCIRIKPRFRIEFESSEQD